MLNSLVSDHDLRLLLLALVVCAFGAASTVNLSGGAAARRWPRLAPALPGLCAGATAWAAHFIAMLAYEPGVAATYHAGRSALAFGVGVLVMGLGFHFSGRPPGSGRSRALGGAVVGLGVVLLHYLGMAALRAPGTPSYTPELVATSVALAVGFGAVALPVALGPARTWSRAAGALLLVAMIGSLHATAMGAVRIERDLAVAATVGGVSRTGLAAAAAVAALAVLVIGLTGALVDRRVADGIAADAARFRALADGAFEGVVVHRHGRILDANAAARRLLGLDDRSDARIDDWFAPSPGGRWARAAEGEPEPVEIELRRPDGSTFTAEISRRRVELAEGDEGELIALRDLTGRKASEARIAHLALHDAVTELPNRRLFLELGHKATSVAQRAGELLSVLVLDVDDFKLVNDRYGHDAGDAVLRAMAERISHTLREADVCARFGGDEFTILQTAVSQPAQTIALVERLLEAIQPPVTWHGAEIMVGVSVGAAVFPQDGTTMDQLLRNADTAMYRAKASGKGTSRFFEAHMDAALVARRTLEGRLRQTVAGDGDGFTVAYQPRVSSGVREAVAFEALLRWSDAELGTVDAAAFIPVAEETGMIVPIGEFVLRRACLDAMQWPSPLRVAVNLSAAQFRRRGLVESVRRILVESGLPGPRLELEVTEALLIEGGDDARRQLDALRELGIHIAMDDFGTGFSSLTYLQSFPFDELKIDRAFVSKVPEDAQSVAIVQAVVAMGRSLGMRVVAEGVETEAQAELLERLGCDDMQGFLVAHPMPAAEIGTFLRGSPARPTGSSSADATDATDAPGPLRPAARP